MAPTPARQPALKKKDDRKDHPAAPDQPREVAPKPGTARKKAPKKASTSARKDVDTSTSDDDDDRKMFSTRLPEDMIWDVKRAAMDHRTTVQDLVTDAIALHLERLGAVR